MRLVATTLRYRVNGGSGPANLPDELVIFALWHNRLGLCMKAYESFVRPHLPHDHLAALVSASKDGALFAAILQRFGVQPVRGSSSRRGARALRELASWARRGFDLAVTPDGPRALRYVLQEGVIKLAQATGLPIIPYSCQVSWKFRVKSWDGFQIPLPFARCQMTFDEAIRVPHEATDAECARLGGHLGAVLLAGTLGE
jgi:lysophospholipid acyltransferase (LPLAT)-like uncharacterized protein